MSPVGRFALKVGLWLPVCYGVWYFSSIISVIPLASVLDMFMTWLLPNLIGGIEPAGNKLLVTTQLSVPHPDAATTMVGLIRFETHPLDYGYCVPLYTALVLASPGDHRRKVFVWLVGMAILFVVQLFGVSTGIMKILAFHIDGAAREQLAFSPAGYELLALAFKFGYLILPPISPILLWIVQFRSFLSDLTGAESSRKRSEHYHN
ncbi:exosortase H-associated membrane protein [Thiocapsa marina]|uniref:Uncharacterized protein n=1 Tax=Thiocapsa marina 5811 TaxID=768671 RepID=F9U964_9GAMM|nr:exosortase H-associated membrane protein [Thiocapsa marina]EGV19322.1 hypothetical protein ThimaDRAFT_1466 [Thiocapsa marina 5811]